MDWAAFFASGRAVDFVLVVLIAEGFWLVLARTRPMLDVVLLLLPGAFILLAVRAALTEAGWPMIALWLALSLPAHAADLARRRW